MTNALTTATLLVTYVSAFVPWAFVIAYHRISRGAWRRDPMGWHIMAITGIDGGIFTMLVFVLWWSELGASLTYKWASLLMVAGIPAVTIWRGVILWRIYQERPPSARRPPMQHPLMVWQAVLALAQVANANLVSGVAGGRLALFIGLAQVALGFYAYGRARATQQPPEVSQ